MKSNKVFQLRYPISIKWRKKNVKIIIKHKTKMENTFKLRFMFET